MSKLAPDDQTISVGGRTRRLFLKQETGDRDVAQVSLSQVTDALRDAFHDIAKLAKEMQKAKLKAPARRLLDAQTAPVLSLALDEICACGVELAPRLPYAGSRDFTGPERAPRAISRVAPPLSAILNPIKLDPLTVADDPEFLNMMTLQPNVPAPIKDGLNALY